MRIFPACVYRIDYGISGACTLQTTDTQTAGTSASAFLFADAALDIVGFNLEFTSSDANVLVITGGEVFNPNTAIGPRFDVDPPFNVTSAGLAEIFPIAITGHGFNTSSGGPIAAARPDLVDPTIGAFVPSVGTLVARLDYDLVSLGDVALNIS